MGAYFLLEIQFDFGSPLKFIIYLKLKTYPGDFLDNTFLTIIYLNMFFEMMQNTLRRKETIGNIIYLIFSHGYFYYFYVVPNTLSLKGLETGQGTLIARVLERIQVEDLDQQNYD